MRGRARGRRGTFSIMTRNPDTPETTETTDRPTASTAADRTRAELDDLADVLDEVISEGQRKLTGDGRIRSEGKESCRIKWANAVVRAAKTRQQIIKNRDLAEMHEEIERLKQQQGWN